MPPCYPRRPVHRACAPRRPRRARTIHGAPPRDGRRPTRNPHPSDGAVHAPAARAPSSRSSRTSTASCPGSSSTPASSTRPATAATPCSSGSSSWRSSPATSTSSSRSASPACASRSRPAPSPGRPTAARPASSSRPPASASSSSSPTTRRSSSRSAGPSPPRASRSSTTPSIPEHHAALRQRFLDEIFPVLTPLAVDPGHPFPYISTLSLSIAVGLRDPETGERVFARVKVPQILPRLLEVEPDHFVPIDQVIEANLQDLFTGMEVVEAHLFRVTRNADFTVEEDEADDLLMAIEEELRRRRFGEAVRLEVERTMPAAHAHAAAARPRPRGRRQLRDRRHARPDRAVADRRARPAGPAGRAVDPGHAAAPRPARRGRAGRRVRRDPRRRHPRPPPVRLVRRVGRALHHAGRRRPRRPDDQADPVPHVRRLAHRPVAHPRRRARQAGRRPRRDQGPLRRGGQHHLGAQAGAGRRPRRLRPGRAQDALEDGARRAPRGLRAAPLRPHRDGQLQPQDRAALRGPRACSPPARRSARTSPTCSTC